MHRCIVGSKVLAFSQKAATARSREIQGSDMARPFVPKTTAVRPSSGRQIEPKTTKNVKLVTN